MRAPPITANKVRVEDCGAAMEDAKKQKTERNEEEPMDMSDMQVCENSRVPRVNEEKPRVDKGDFSVSVQGSEDVREPLHTGPRNFVRQGVSSNDQFQEKLKEIDAELAKFDYPRSGVSSLYLSKG